jgi:hypothetical protein
MQAVRIGIAGDIEPVAGHFFAEMFGAEIAVDHRLVGIWPRVREKQIDIRDRGGQPREGEGDPANQCRPVRLVRELELFLIETIRDEIIDGYCSSPEWRL